MNTDIFPPLTELTKNFMVPVQKLGSIAVANAEKIIQLQTASLEKYAELGITRWKAALQVSDPESFMNYATAQSAHMNEVSQQVIVDMKRAYYLGLEFLTDARKVAEENVVSFTEMTKEKVAA